MAVACLVTLRYEAIFAHKKYFYVGSPSVSDRAPLFNDKPPLLSLACIFFSMCYECLLVQHEAGRLKSADLYFQIATSLYLS